MNKNYFKSLLLASTSFFLVGAITSCSSDDDNQNDNDNNNQTTLLSAYQNSSLRTELAYDSNNRLIQIKEMEINEEPSDPSITDITYDNQNRIIQVKYTYNQNSNNIETIETYTYSGDTIIANAGLSNADTLLIVNNLLQRKLSKFAITDYTYDSSGNILESSRISRSSKTSKEKSFYVYNTSEKGLLFDAIVPSWFNVYSDYLEIISYTPNLCIEEGYKDIKIENGVEIEDSNPIVNNITYEYDNNKKPVKIISQNGEGEKNIALLEYYKAK